MILLNARLDAKSARRHRKQAWFYQPLMACFSRIYAQNSKSQTLLRGLNLRTVAPLSGNIKALAPAQAVNAAELQSWQARVAGRPVWVLASSHCGEEAIALQAHQALLARHPRALLVIVPRNVFRGAEIAALVDGQGMRGARRSIDEALQPSHSVYVADTMGELGLWYTLSQVALVGGSLVPIGGHNPYEARAAACAVISGPNVHNFSESYEELLCAGQARMVHDATELARAVADTWANGSVGANRAAIDSQKLAHDQPVLLMDILEALGTSPKP